MKILCVVEHDAPSERFIHRDVALLREQNVEVTVWPCSEALPADGRVPDASTLARTAILAWRMHGLRGLTWAPRARRALGHFSSHDIVWGHFAGIPAVYAYLIARSIGRPFLLSVHARDVFVPWRPGLRAARCADICIACSEASQKALADACGPKIPTTRLIHHALPRDLLDQPPSRCDAPEGLLAAGRFIEKKGFSVLLKALAILRSRGAATSLTLAGDGPLRAALVEETESLGLVDLVTFPGFLPEESLRDQMAAAALLVCPSVIASDGDRDGIPNVLLEAMALRVPVVASSVGGISEAIRDGQDGLLVAQGDPHALADRIQEALCRPEDARRRAESARQRLFERHHPDAISAQLVDLFNGIAEASDAD